MKLQTWISSLLALVAYLPAAASAMDAWPTAPHPSGPEAVGLLLIGLLALGLREGDALDPA